VETELNHWIKLQVSDGDESKQGSHREESELQLGILGEKWRSRLRHVYKRHLGRGSDIATWFCSLQHKAPKACHSSCSGCEVYGAPCFKKYRKVGETLVFSDRGGGHRGVPAESQP